MKISDLIPADYNPRQISDKAKQGLSNSISRFGLVQPIVWNKKTQSIVGGHQRLYDLQEKGASKTDVVVVSLSSEEEKALNIALNHKGIQGEFIEAELVGLLKGIEDQELLEDLNLEDLATMDEWEDNDLDEELSPPFYIRLKVPGKNSYIKEDLVSEVSKLIENHFSEDNIEVLK